MYCRVRVALYDRINRDDQRSAMRRSLFHTLRNLACMVSEWKKDSTLTETRLIAVDVRCCGNRTGWIRLSNLDKLRCSRTQARERRDRECSTKRKPNFTRPERRREIAKRKRINDKIWRRVRGKKRRGTVTIVAKDEQWWKLRLGLMQASSRSKIKVGCLLFSRPHTYTAAQPINMLSFHAQASHLDIYKVWLVVVLRSNYWAFIRLLSNIHVWFVALTGSHFVCQVSQILVNLFRNSLWALMQGIVNASKS